MRHPSHSKTTNILLGGLDGHMLLRKLGTGSEGHARTRWAGSSAPPSGRRATLLPALGTSYPCSSMIAKESTTPATSLPQSGEQWRSYGSSDRIPPLEKWRAAVARSATA